MKHGKNEQNIKETLRKQGLYYTPPQIQGTYTEDASGELDPTQIPISNKWYYTQKISDDSQTDDDNKMTLIITDPTHHYLFDNLAKDRWEKYLPFEKVMWELLFELGFEIYVWTATGPLKCNGHDELLKGLKLIVPQPKSHVKRNAKISSPDRTLVLDLKAVRALIDYLYTELRFPADVSNVELPFADRLVNYALISPESLRLAMPGINPVDFSPFRLTPNEYNASLSHLLSVFIQHGKLNSFNIFDYLNSNTSPHLILSDIIKFVKKRDGENPDTIFLELNDIFITQAVVDMLDSAPFIRVVRAYISLHPQVTQLPNFEYIESLTIIAQNTITWNIPKDKFQRLKKLSVRDSALNATNIKLLLTATPHIEALSIGSVDELESSEVSDSNNTDFPVLHELKSFIYSVQSSSMMLADLLNMMPNLDHLTLQNKESIKNIDKELQYAIKKGIVSSNKITRLELNSFEFSEGILYEFLNQFPHLQSITLTHCRVIGNRVENRYAALRKNSNIVRLNLNSVHIKDDCFSNIISHFGENLETLYLVQCKVEHTDSIKIKEYQPGSLPKLKKFLINNTACNARLIFEIWQNSSALEELDVLDYNCNLRSSGWQRPIDFIDQPRLSVCRLHGSETAVLSPLIYHMPNVTNLQLSTIYNIKYFEDEQKHVGRTLLLEKLIALYIHCCSTSPSFLNSFLLGAPNLKMLRFDNYIRQADAAKMKENERLKKNSSERADRRIKCLATHLERVSFFSHENVSLSNIQEFFQNPNLRSISLENMHHIDLSDPNVLLNILRTAKCNNLEYASFDNTKISLKSLVLFLEHFDKLKEISFTRSKTLSSRDIEVLLKLISEKLPNVRVAQRTIYYDKNSRRGRYTWKMPEFMGRLVDSFIPGRRKVDSTTGTKPAEKKADSKDAEVELVDSQEELSRSDSSSDLTLGLPDNSGEVGVTDKPAKTYTKDEMIGVLKKVNELADTTFNEEKIKEIKSKLKPAKVDFSRDQKKEDNIPAIKIDPKNIKESLGWITKNYHLILEHLEEPLAEYRRNYGHLSVEDIKNIIKEVDNSVIVSLVLELLSRMDLENTPSDDWINQRSIRIFISVLPEIIALVKASLIVDKRDSERAIREMSIKLTLTGVPFDIQKHLIKILTHAIDLVVDLLPKLHDLVNDVEALKSPYSLLKIIKIVSILRLIVSYRSLIKEIAELKLPDDPTHEDADDEKNYPVTVVEDESNNHLDSEFIELVLDDTLAVSNKKRSQFSFKTWKTLNTNGCKTFEEFWGIVSQTLEKKQPITPNALINLPGENITSFNFEMMKCLRKTGNSHYFMNNLDDTYLTTLVVDQGVPKKSSTEFGLFCEQAKPGDVLVVNISKHRRGLNSITDTYGRTFRDKKIPDGVKVVVLVDSDLPIQLDGDIYGRCSVRTHFKLFPSLQSDSIIVEKILPNNNENNLYHDPRGWEQPVLGNFHLAGKQISFVNGLIAQALLNKVNDVHLINAPIESEEFLNWLYSIASKEKVFFNGQWHALPKDFKVHLYEKPYELFTEQCQFELFNREVHGDYDFALNQATFHRFLKNHDEKNKKLFESPGWLAAKQSPHIFVNGELSRDQWAQLIDEIIARKLVVKFTVLKKEYCPIEYANKLVEMKINSTSQAAKTMPMTHQSSRVDLIVTNNIDACVETLKKQSGLHIEFEHPLTEEDTYDNLFSYLHTEEVGIDYLVDMRNGPVWQALQDTKTVVLYGSLSPTLRAKLSLLFSDTPRLWINGKMCHLKGRLIIVTDPKHDVCFAKNRYVDSAPTLISVPPTILNVNSEQNIKQARYDAVNGLFTHHPWVRILGEFGVGKSYFGINEFKEIAEKLDESESVTVFVGEESIEAYGEYKTNGRKLLILDEYNLKKNGYWDKFKSMRSTIASGFTHNRVFYPTRPLTKTGYKDLILFMANPKAKNYEGRQHHEFIDTLVPTVIFNEFPRTFLINDIILPMLKEALSDHPCYFEAQKHAITLCEIYDKIKAIASSDKAISVRNLTMLIVRFVVYCKRSSVNDALVNATLEEALYLLEDDKKIDELFDFLSQQFSLKQPSGDHIDQMVEDVIALMAKNNYFLTESRRPILKQLLSMLIIREQTLLNPMLDAHLIRGILIEGETRIGKSALLKKLLLALGFHDGFSEGVAVDPLRSQQKTFYQFTANSDIKMMERVVNKVGDDGVVQIIDELNMAPLEGVLGGRMTGVDKKGKKAMKPGGRIFATQNPANSYSSREPLSDSIKNRFIILTMPEILTNELREIVEKIGAGDKTDPLVDAFLRDHAYAKKHGLFPLPSPEDLFRAAAEVKRMRMEDTGEQYFYNFEEDEPEVAGKQEAKNTPPTVLDKLKDRIIQLQEAYLKLRPATWAETFRHPITTFKNWLERRRKNREIHDAKHLWLTAKTDSIIQAQTTPKAFATNHAEISAKTANQFTTRYLMTKFRDLPQAVDKAQVKEMASELKKENKLFSANIDLSGEKGKLHKKMSKLQLWAEVQSKLGATNKNKEMHAFSAAKYELLEAEVKLLNRI